MSSRNRPALQLTEPQKRVLLQLRIRGEAPRVHLAHMLGMNGAAMTRLTQQLIALGLIEERVGSGSQARGRPMIPLAISGEGGWAIGATVQPGWMELALVDFLGRPLVHDSQPFDSPDPLIFARTLEGRLRLLAAEHGFMRGKFLGLGVAVPGYARHGERDRRAVVPWLAGWNDVPLTDVLGDALGMPVWIENDGAAAVLAEYYQDGIIGRYRSVLVLFLGHGVGGGVIAERDLFLGEHGNAGEIGRLFPNGRPRPSGLDLIQTLRGAGIAINSLSEVAALLDSHASLIDEWTERVTQQLEYAIISGTAWLDPGAIVVSGALPRCVLQALTERLVAINEARDPSYRGTLPAIHASRIGSLSVVVGAAMAPIHAVTAPDTVLLNG